MKQFYKGMINMISEILAFSLFALRWLWYNNLLFWKYMNHNMSILALCTHLTFTYLPEYVWVGYMMCKLSGAGLGLHHNIVAFSAYAALTSSAELDWELEWWWSLVRLCWDWPGSMLHTHTAKWYFSKWASQNSKLTQSWQAVPPWLTASINNALEINTS